MNQTNKTNLTIRITNEARQILKESASRLGLDRVLVYENAACTLPKLTNSLKTLDFRRVSGQVGLPKFTNTYHLNRKQNGNMKVRL